MRANRAKIFYCPEGDAASTAELAEDANAIEDLNQEEAIEHARFMLTDSLSPRVLRMGLLAALNLIDELRAELEYARNDIRSLERQMRGDLE